MAISPFERKRINEIYRAGLRNLDTNYSQIERAPKLVGTAVKYRADPEFAEMHRLRVRLNYHRKKRRYV